MEKGEKYILYTKTNGLYFGTYGGIKKGYKWGRGNHMYIKLNNGIQKTTVTNKDYQHIFIKKITIKKVWQTNISGEQFIDTDKDQILQMYEKERSRN